jgi:hypothetical protein
MSDTEMTTPGRAADSGPLTSGVRARAEFTARGKAFRFPKGQSGNPDGQARFYHQSRKLAREASPEMMRELIDLAKTAEDERVRSVCLIAVLDRAGVRPIDFDPAQEQAKRPPPFDPSLFTIAELKQLQAAMTLIAVRQGLLPPEAIENAVEPTVEEGRDERRFASSHVRGNRC